ncbi:transcriptional regulator, MerR family [Flavobacterium segetis]|uniref:Transcriptional regulator, MerR family n=1 Tax=Flavobacterium segetis TaxID=271157 RepID=A0A1M5GBQ6_9FLAO|nr:MerR family transcriptional regulator [Flavobacterium segetis]SHG01129.1 transcriptional regulator, MerR family [Flavobacterium segetis]
MLINELSKRTGITSHTIRFYEKSGLIKGNRDDTVKSNNYFHYDEETVDKLELIRDAKAIGYTISEIAQLIEAWYSNTFSKDEKVAFLDEKLSSLDQKIKDLKEMKNLISQYKKDVLNDEC